MGQNIYTAGTLNLKVGDDDPCTVSINIGPIAPGDVLPHLRCGTITNTGTEAGYLSIVFSSIINYENGRTEAEWNDPDNPDTTGGTLEGELGDHIWVTYAEVCSMGWGQMASLDKWEYLNHYGGQTYADLITLEPNESVQFQMKVYLDKDVGNIIQSDSVEFTITFHLTQFPYEA